METSIDTKGRKQPAKKKRRTEDDFKRDIASKKSAIAETNPITAVWDKANEAQRREFVKARHVGILGVQQEIGAPKRGRGRPKGSKNQPKRKGGWPKGKPRKRQEAAE
jgi:hypothetical protein